MTDATLLTDDHLDLLVTAAREWRVLIPRTMAAFNEGLLQEHFVIGAANEVGNLIRQENTHALGWLAEHGRTKLVDRHQPAPYRFQPVEHLDPVEVVKAAHAATSACEPSPSWAGSPVKRLIDAVLRAAILRIDGYAEAPWLWTRPLLRSGDPIGVALGDQHPTIPGLRWVEPQAIAAHWEAAPVVIFTVPAALEAPPALKPRAGVFVLSDGDDQESVWNALVTLDMQALVLLWPACEPWLLDQLNSPDREFTEYRHHDDRFGA
ncbi:hypothetical protein [Tessaracoccus sp. Z1128]